MNKLSFLKRYRTLLSIQSTILIAFLFGIPNLNAQTDLTFELQIYPTGILPGISVDYSFTPKSVLYGRIGLNLFDHRDLGEQDEETGSGYGFSIGYKNYIKETRTGLRWGIKTDLWRNTVDWANDSGTSGETKIIVLQPTAELSYVFRKERLVIAPSLAFGLEWNIDTDGLPTGEGPIVLIGVQIGRAF